MNRIIKYPPKEKIALTNIFGNILAFMPLGFLIPGLIKKYRSFYRVFIISMIVSITIEIIQLLLRIGSTDIDDVFLNTIGGLVGFLLLRIILRFIQRGNEYYDKVDQEPF